MDDALFDFMDIYNDQSLPDGAWQAMLQDAVEVYNKVNGTDHEPHQSFLDYVSSDQCQK